MINSSKYVLLHERHRPLHFETHSDEGNIIAQICGSNLDEIERTANHIVNVSKEMTNLRDISRQINHKKEYISKDLGILKERNEISNVVCIDINLGCPQGIARRGNYGSFLLENEDLVVTIIQGLCKSVKYPLSVKMRLLPLKGREKTGESDIPRTLRLIRKFVDAGVDMISIHARTRFNKGCLTTAADWNSIKSIREHFPEIPIIANGGIGSMEEANKCLDFTGVNAVMCAEALLENPCMFSGEIFKQTTMAREYIYFAKKYNTPLNLVKGLTFKLLLSQMEVMKHLRPVLSKADSIDAILNIITLIEEEKDLDLYQRSFYSRHIE